MGEPAALSPRAERQRRLREISRAQLLDAAEAEFAQRGFEATAVKEIADRAELSVGTVYQLFESKRAIFRAVFQRRNQQALALLRATVDSADTPSAQLHHLLNATLDFYTKHRDFFLVFQRAVGGSWLNVRAGFESRNFEEYTEFLDLPAGIFGRGKADGTFVAMDPKGMAVMYTGMVQAFLLHEVIGLDHNPATSPPLVARDQFHDLVDRAFLAPGRATGG